jgi:succinyl-CoA synthetase beta subunit
MAVALPPSVTSLEINPLLVLPEGEGVLMLDVAMEVET